MATALDTLALPRCSALPSRGGLSPVAARRGFAQFRGLKVSAPILLTHSAQSLNLAPTSNRVARIRCEAQNTAVEVAPATEASWKSLVLDADTPVVVEFWAPWCGPCRMIHPIVDELAKEYVGKVKFFKVNTDDNPNIANQYGIRSIPTVIMFKNGEKKEAIIGAVPKSTLNTSIEKFL